VTPLRRDLYSETARPLFKRSHDDGSGTGEACGAAAKLKPVPEKMDKAPLLTPVKSRANRALAPVGSFVVTSDDFAVESKKNELNSSGAPDDGARLEVFRIKDRLDPK
jgi:hypothetical protein